MADKEEIKTLEENGRNSNLPNLSVDSSMITLSGFWKANIAIYIFILLLRIQLYD